MAETIAGLGEGLEIWKVPIDDLREQDLNARVMSKRMFEHLSATIGKDKRLESLPLCAKTRRGIEIVSGHHRIRAARAAGVTEVFTIVDVTGLSRDEIKAKQLAHNAIAGVDDDQTLAKLYKSIEDVNARIESFIDPETVDAIMDRLKLAPPKLFLGTDYRTVVITFLPYEKARFEAAVESLLKGMPIKDATLYLAELETFAKWKEIVGRVGGEYDIRAYGTLLSQMARIVEDYLGVESDLPEPVPIRDAMGVALVDQETGSLLKRAIKQSGGIREMAEKVLDD